jgi:hypothetical protein
MSPLLRDLDVQGQEGPVQRPVAQLEADPCGPGPVRPIHGAPCPAVLAVAAAAQCPAQDAPAPAQEGPDPGPGLGTAESR